MIIMFCLHSWYLSVRLLSLYHDVFTIHLLLNVNAVCKIINLQDLQDAIDSPTAMVLWKKLASAVLALIAKTKNHLILSLFTLTSLHHSNKSCKNLFYSNLNATLSGLVSTYSVC